MERKIKCGKMNLKLTVTIMSIWLVHLTSYGQDETLGRVKLKLKYMAYACGECYPEYSVVKILLPKKYSQFKWLKGKDIYVDFSASENEELEKMRVTCAVCFFYDVEGILTKTQDARFILKPENYRVYERGKNCCAAMTKMLEEGRKESVNKIQ